VRLAKEAPEDVLHEVFHVVHLPERTPQQTPHERHEALPNLARRGWIASDEGLPERLAIRRRRIGPPRL
jgi:hypothetical protein